MSTQGKTRRLFQVAREFNVSTSTIVETLRQKGFKITDSITTDLSEEMYGILSRQFAEDRQRNREVESVKADFLGRSRRHEPTALDDLEPMDLEPEPAPVKKSHVPDPIDFLEPVLEPEPEPVPTPPVVTAPVPPKPSPIVQAPPATPVVTTPITPEPAPVSPAAKVPPVVSAPKAPAPVPVVNPTPKAVEPTPVVEKPAPTAPVKEEPKVVEPAPVVAPQPSTLPDVVDEDEDDNDQIGEASQEEAEVIRAQREQLEGTRVLGKITIPQRPVAGDASRKKKNRKKKISAAGEGAPSGENKPVEGAQQRPAYPAREGAKKAAEPARQGSGPFPMRQTTPASGSAPRSYSATGLPQQGRSGGPARPGQPGQPSQPGQQARDGQRTKPGQLPAAPGTTPVFTSTGATDRNKKKKERDRHSLEEEKAVPKGKEALLLSGADALKKRSKLRKKRREDAAHDAEEQERLDAQQQNILQVSEYISVSDLAELLGVSAAQLIGTAMKAGMFVSINQRLDAASIELLAAGYDKEVSFVDAEEVLDTDDEDELDDPEDLVARPPVVTVMGHVDHGKTSLLDYIKNSKVAAGEAGGITQHIGAYSVKLDDGRLITFLDTPGHEAFTAMRARGAKATDIVILVVAADDAVMPQTIEAINHAQAAGVPIVVAVNKMDKPDANPDRIKQQLSEHNVLVEEWGGKTQCVLVSAKTGKGIDDLLESVLVEAELMELKANPARKAQGVVLESRVDKGKGAVATILVQNGTLRVGDPFVAGQCYGRIRALENERGERLQEVGPATPALVTGFDGMPQAGDKVTVTEDERTAKTIAMQRQQIKREQDMRRVKHMTLDDLSRRMALGNVSQLNIIIKGDVDGSIEALSGSLQKLSTDEVQVKIIHTGVGAITESDVLLASASDAIIIGFQVRPSANARKLAESEQIDIRLFSIIYDALDAVKDAMEGMLSPELSEKTLATVQVREIFKVPGVGTIGGCFVQEGKIERKNRIRLIRDGVVIFTGEISSLKRFKDDVREVNTGFECGIGIHNYNDLKVGDVIEAFEVVETKRKLSDIGAS